MTRASQRLPQTLVGGLVTLTGLGLALGALRIPGEAGYGGVGPNFLPWVVAIGLTACGGLILREAFTGGFRELEQQGADRAWWPALAWISAGMLANAALITTIGFVLSCTLCYLLAVQGLRRAQGQGGATSLRALASDVLGGLVLAAPVYWVFTKFLGINLPGITATGWI